MWVLTTTRLCAGGDSRESRDCFKANGLSLWTILISDVFGELSVDWVSIYLDCGTNYSRDPQLFWQPWWPWRQSLWSPIVSLIWLYLGLAHSISPHHFWGDIHLDFCWVPKRRSSRMKWREGRKGGHLIRQLRIRSRGSRGAWPQCAGKGELHLYLITTRLFFPEQIVWALMAPGWYLRVYEPLQAHTFVVHKLMQIWLTFECTSVTHWYTWGRGAEYHNSPMKYIQIRKVSHYSPVGW